jgi:peptidoglycan hydrolase-like protein with peptidoglycan-binding domain
MVDSAFPLKGPPPGGWPPVILIYAGGDTPHPWTTAEILAMPARYRWPCWVRSNPQSVSAMSDAAAFVLWLGTHKVPGGTCVILDLETAVDTAYVAVFNSELRAAGYKVTKYGSTSTIWKNPKTDGGTYIASSGPSELTGVGDEVARQYAFDNGYDRSVLLDQAALPLWDTHAAPPPPPAPPAANWLEKIMATLPVVGPGSSNASMVRKIQGLLIAGGFLAPVAGLRSSAIDGIYGTATTAAVKKAQSAHKAKADGITGPVTWGILIAD